MALNIYKDKSLLKDAENEQNEIKILLNKLRNYNPTKPKKVKSKKETLSAAEKLLNNRQEVIGAFKTKIDFKKKNRKKNQKVTLKDLSNILRMNQRV